MSFIAIPFHSTNRLDGEKSHKWKSEGYPMDIVEQLDNLDLANDLALFSCNNAQMHNNIVLVES